MDFPFEQEPMVTLQRWLDEASVLEPTNPNAAALATVTVDGKPLPGWEPKGDRFKDRFFIHIWIS